jgi:cytochrome P450
VQGVATPSSTAEPLTTSLPSGPRWPAPVQSLVWTVALPWLLNRCGRRYGDMFTLTFSPGKRRIVMVSGAERVKAVFAAPPEVAPSATGISPIAPVLGPNSVLTLTGAEHMRMRKLLLPPFHGERVGEYEQVVVEATRRNMSSWPMGKPMRLQDHIMEIALEVILRAVFGMEAARMGEELQKTIEELFALLGLPVALLLTLRPSLATRPTGRYGRALENLDRVIYAEIARRRAEAGTDERGDILSLLLQARDKEGRELTDAELRDELVTLVLAGHETTATTVTWAIERLVRHPDRLERLIAENDVGESDAYMQAVIEETLRVRPVVPMVVRILQEPLQVGKYHLPEGTRVAVSIFLTNRDERVYESPLEFRPERFLENRPETFSWIPFGGGIRRCLGAPFAMLEMKLIMSTMLKELRPSLPRRRGRLFNRDELTLHRAVLVPWRDGRVVWTRREDRVEAA